MRVARCAAALALSFVLAAGSRAGRRPPADRDHHHRSQGARRGGGRRSGAPSRAWPAPGRIRTPSRSSPASSRACGDAALLVRIGLDHEPWLRPRPRHGRRRRAPPGGAGRPRRLARGRPAADRDAARARRRAARTCTASATRTTGSIPRTRGPSPRRILAALARAVAPPTRARLRGTTARRFLERLDAGLARWQARWRRYAGARVVVVHESWPYFAARFGLDDRGRRRADARACRPRRPRSAHSSSGCGRRGVRVLVAEPYASAALVRQVADKSGGRAVDAGALGRRRRRGPRLPRRCSTSTSRRLADALGRGALSARCSTCWPCRSWPA